MARAPHHAIVLLATFALTDLAAAAPITQPNASEQAFIAAMTRAVSAERKTSTAASLVDADALAARAGIADEKPDLARFFDPLVIDGSFAFVRATDARGQRQLLFRQRGHFLNYVLFTVAPAPDGQTRAIDLYDLTAGATASEILRRESAARAGTDEVSVAIQTLTALKAAKRYPDLLAAFDKLSPRVKGDRQILELRFDAARHLTPADVDHAIDDLSAAFPDDPSVMFRSVESLLRRNFFDEALARVDAVGKTFDDPLLGWLRAEIYFAANRPREAIGATRAVIAAAPGDIPTLLVMVRAALASDDFPTVSEALTHFLDDAHARLVDLRAMPAFSAYLASDEYHRWATARKLSASDSPATRR